MELSSRFSELSFRSVFEHFLYACHITPEYVKWNGERGSFYVYMDKKKMQCIHAESRRPFLVYDLFIFLSPETDSNFLEEMENVRDIEDIQTEKKCSEPDILKHIFTMYPIENGNSLANPFDIEVDSFLSLNLYTYDDKLTIPLYGIDGRLCDLIDFTEQNIKSRLGTYAGINIEDNTSDTAAVLCNPYDSVRMASESIKGDYSRIFVSPIKKFGIELISKIERFKKIAIVSGETYVSMETALNVMELLASFSSAHKLTISVCKDEAKVLLAYEKKENVRTGSFFSQIVKNYEMDHCINPEVEDQFQALAQNNFKSLFIKSDNRCFTQIQFPLKYYYVKSFINMYSTDFLSGWIICTDYRELENI